MTLTFYRRYEPPTDEERRVEETIMKRRATSSSVRRSRRATKAPSATTGTVNLAPETTSNPMQRPRHDRGRRFQSILEAADSDDEVSTGGAYGWFFGGSDRDPKDAL